MKVNDIIQKALNEIGTTEFPPNSNRCKYNRDFYGRDVSGPQYPWCCTFVWWVFHDFIKNFPKTASCINLASWFKKEGRFFYRDPKVGDVVFFKFNTNDRWTNHVGIVVEIKGTEIKSIEGNTSINSDDNGGAVMLRSRKANIVGYGRPQYDNSKTDNSPKKEPVLKKGDRNDYVKAWQEYLITCKINCGKSGADGIFGSATEKAVKEYQKKKGLPITGVIDDDDWMSVGR